MTNLNNFKEAQKLLGEERSKNPERTERRFFYLASKIPQERLKSFNWHEERRIFKSLCRGDPMPQVSRICLDFFSLIFS